MAINSTGLQPGKGAGEENNSPALPISSDVTTALSAVSLRCVECSTLYPALEPGQASPLPRYRCICGGVLDVEMPFNLPGSRSSVTREDAAGDDLPPGSGWRQLFDERATTPPIWSISTDRELLDTSGVWRYRELILPAPEAYVVSRPEGNTSLYPVGSENCGPGRAGHRQIGSYAGLERFFLKHEGENPTGSFKDRGMTVGVTMARMLGAKAVACASTGNTSASLASYAAQAGMRGIVFLPAGHVAGGKLAQSLAYGAQTIQIAGDFDDAMRLVEQV
ncbi:MAG TPA: pyridoxal-phosphate dependent enzyme, partial [Ktedonobacteraceae bacterium]